MAICTKNRQKGGTPPVEDNEKEKNNDPTRPYLGHWESLGISKNIIRLFIHLQEQKHEQNHREASNSRI
jgi:hypothetical protein